MEPLETRQLLSALVHTDAVDYAPNTIAAFTALNDTNPGTNFQAGETINFHVGRTDGIPINSPPAVQDWSVVNGPDGSVVTNWNVDPQFEDASLSVTATGATSGATATAFFTDGYPAAVSVTPVSGTTQTYGTSGNAVYTVKVTDNSDGDPLSAWLTTPSLPAGVTATFSSNPGSPNRFKDFGNGHYGLQFDQGEKGAVGYATLTLTTSTTASAGNDSFTVEVAKNSDPTHGFKTTTGSLTINKASDTLTVSDAGGVYNGSQYTATATVNGGSSLDGVPLTFDYHQFNYGTGNWTDLGATAPTDTGYYFATAIYAGSSNHVPNTANSSAFSITPKYITGNFTVAGKTYDGGTSATVTGTTLTGVVGIDNVQLVAGAATFANKNAGSEAVSMTGASLSGTKASDYYLQSVANSTATIGQAPLTISAIWSSKTYDGTTTVTDGATPTAIGVVGTDTVTNLTESFVSPNAGPDVTQVINPGFVIHDGNGGNNYQVTIHQGCGAITKADAIIDAETYDQAYAEFGGAVYNDLGWGVWVGAIGVDGWGVQGLTINGKEWDAHTNAGTYIDRWAFTDKTGNYNDASGTLIDIIAPATATVTVTAIPRLVYDGSPQETASYSATGVYGVALPSSDFTDTTVHTDAGNYTDTWTFTDPNYVTQTGHVTDNIARANAHITPSFYTVTYDGQSHAPTAVVTGINDVVLVHLTGTSMTNVGTDYQNFDYTDPSGNYNEVRSMLGRDCINQAPLSISATYSTKVYDGTTAVTMRHANRHWPRRSHRHGEQPDRGIRISERGRCCDPG